MKFWALIVLLLGLLVWIAPALAQEGISAEVVQTTSIRTCPNARNIAGVSEAVQPLSTGETVLVRGWESVDGATTWVWVMHPASGAVGWIRADRLSIQEADWQMVLSPIQTYDELADFLVKTAPNGYQVTFRGGGGGYGNLNVRTAPYLDSELIGKIPQDSPMTVLGRARINDYASAYVYVRENATGLEGWVTGAQSLTQCMWSPRVYWIDAIPIIYDSNPLERYAGLPQLLLSNVQLRETPNVESPSVLSDNDPLRVRRNYSVAIIGRTADETQSTGWLKVVMLSNGVEGWVSASIVEMTSVDYVDLPIVASP